VARRDDEIRPRRRDEEELLTARGQSRRAPKPRINRLAQVIRALRVSRLLLWTIWVIYRERRRVLRARERGDPDARPNVEVLIQVLTEFRTAALQLGVLMIKLGQFLSARADLLPERALAVLASLQDEVPPEPFAHVVSVIESELGGPITEIFSVLEPQAAAAASLGQVHQGILAGSGAVVAVKVQRPHMEQLVQTDLSTLRFVIWLVTRFVDAGDFIDLMGMYREFRRTVLEEIDYVAEAANVRRFGEMFADDVTIRIPRVCDQYVTRHVLVLEWIEGIKINDYPALEAAGIDRGAVANRTVNAYFHQFFVEGFFHADPHPGNIFVQPGPTPQEPTIAFVDFGMVGTLTSEMKQALKDLFLAFLLRDTHALVAALTKLGFIGEDANQAAIERGLGLMMEQYYGISLGEARDLDLRGVGHEIQDLLYGQPFHLPAQFAFTGRAIGTLVGVTTGLDPDFNFIAVATPYARQFLGLDQRGAGQTVQEILTQLLGTARIALDLPRALDRVIRKIETGQIEVRLANGPARGGRRRGGNGGGRSLPLVFAFAVSLVGGIVLAAMHLAGPSWFCLGIAGVSVFGMIVSR
jgi:predicted unusual protein kinase regulating ubiquinone biosynthesis (AarF/ABC1/UbiB family)